MQNRRLKKDYVNLIIDPIPYVRAHPLHDNIFEWHYVLLGPENTPYAGGVYHGKLIFPKNYPYRGPSIYMITPNGRFMTNLRLCFSFSDYHSETWDPSWSVGAILYALLSFMTGNESTTGSIKTSRECKRLFAKESMKFNLTNPIFCEYFPELAAQSEHKTASKSVKKVLCAIILALLLLYLLRLIIEMS
nr:ubiquitin-conjugating enzyme E2 J2-like [Parasteatoda tepidariorum]